MKMAWRSGEFVFGRPRVRNAQAVYSAQCRMAAAMCVCAAGLAGWPGPPPDASEFYIVTVGFSDALPGWRRSVLEVKQDGDGILVRHIRVVPASVYCGEATKIVATATRLPNITLRTITGGVNLCAIDPPALNRTLWAFPQTRDIRVFAGERHAIVAKCGADTRVISLPGDWQVDMARLKRKRPGIAALWELPKAVGTQAFGSFGSIDIVPAEMGARLEPANEAILAEMKSGRFDAGLASLTPRSFKDDVAALRPESDAPEFSVKLAIADGSRVGRFVEPEYPPIAKQARVSGVVELELISNPTTGETEQVTVVSGNPLLARPAKDAAQHWRLLRRADDTTRATRVVLEFVFRCP
jgi:hypothetical protein